MALANVLDDVVTFELDDELDAVPAARRFVHDQLLARGAHASIDDATVVTAELLANACQHGVAPVSVSVSGAAGRVRVAVRDASPRTPVRPNRSTNSMTGRGILLVDALSARWGVSVDEHGKVVWAEFGVTTVDDPLESVRAVEELAGVDAATVTAAERRYTVVLGDVPTDLLIEAKAHMDNLVRELSLAAADDKTRSSEPFRALVQTVVHSFGDARNAIKRQAIAASRRGEQRTSLTLQLPLSAADAAEAYLTALDEADTYSRAARLLTLETPPDHRLFRRWYVEAVARQLRDLAAGREPEQVTPFEDLLVREIRRLASAHRAAERAARLQQVTAALAQTRTPEDVAAVVVTEGIEVLGASGGGLLVPAPDGQHLAVPGAVGYEGGLVHALREELIDAPLPAATALRTGEAIWLESREERDRDFPALRGFEASTVSMCAVPLSVAGQVLGALRFSFDERKLFDQDERGFVLALAAQTAQTLQRTALYQAERRAAVDLQRALLPADVPRVPGWDVATHYSPAGDQEAGGDFYDLLEVAGGRYAAVVGDVMGRGLDAAASMAQVRSAVRAYAVEDPDPVSVFRRVDAFFVWTRIEQLATMVYLLIDPSAGTVQLANAGHVPPLLVSVDGARVVSIKAEPPFGVGLPNRHALVMNLGPGDAVVLITDGLVERRGEDIDEGIGRVLAAAAASAATTADGLLEDILAAATPHGHDDDVTVLVLRRT
jgi:serine phosphatase RsbU (regulator of sigma subunit)/anti-sigma regulatory factor (Ser/Thr protein kinase)